MLSFIVKKKSTLFFFFQLHLKCPCLLSCQFLSLIPTVRGTQPPVKGSDLGQKDLREGLRQMAAWLFFLIFAYFSQKCVFLFSPLQLRKEFKHLENSFRRYTRQQVEPKSVRCRALLPSVKPPRRAPVLPAGRKKLLQSEAVFPQNHLGSCASVPLEHTAGSWDILGNFDHGHFNPDSHFIRKTILPCQRNSWMKKKEDGIIYVSKEGRQA